MTVRAYRFLTPLLALGLWAATPDAPAYADNGTLGVSGGAAFFEREGRGKWHPAARIDLAFRMAGAIEFGAYLDGMAAELPFDGPAFGGGLLIAVRPESAIGRFVPSFEASAGRTQLPNSQRERVRAWAANIGAGLGVEVMRGLTVEGRVRRAWWFGVDERSFGEGAWTLTGGIAVALP